MFVVEYRHGPAAGFEHVHRALKELVAGVLGLTFPGPRVEAVFGDDEHTIEGQLRAAEGQGFFDRGKELHAMAARAFPAEVALVELVDVETSQFKGRLVMTPVPAVAFGKAVKEMLGVGIFPHFGGEEGNFLAARA
jgi:hypothetical protein